MRVFATSTTAALVLLVNGAAASHSLLQRTLQSKGGHHEHAAAAQARAHRRTQVGDYGNFVTNAFGGLKLDTDAFKLVSDISNSKLQDGLLSSITDQLKSEDATMAFNHFKVLQTMPAYKDFLASGSTDPAEKVEAQLTALKDLVISGIESAKAVVDEGGPAGMVQELLAEGSEELQKDMEAMTSGDPNAFHRIQQAFADKFLGGPDIMALYDNEWVENARKEFFDDENLSRVLGDKGILSILQNARMLNPSIGDMGETGMMAALEGFLPDYS